MADLCAATASQGKPEQGSAGEQTVTRRAGESRISWQGVQEKL